MKVIYKAIDGGIDGRDCSCFAIFTKRADAEKAIIGRGPSGGGDGWITEEILYESLADFNKNNPDARRKRALKKLSPEDRNALGVSD